MLDPSKLTASQINKRLDKLDELDSIFTDKMIEAGRGNERPSDYLNKTDSLSITGRKIFDERSSLRNEIERRYGPGSPRRLPKGFGPLKNMPKLPKGFGQTLKRLYAQGYDRKQAFREAWRIHGSSRRSGPKRRNPKRQRRSFLDQTKGKIEAWVGYVAAPKYKYLLGGQNYVESSPFETREIAMNWAGNTRDTNVDAGREVEEYGARKILIWADQILKLNNSYRRSGPKHGWKPKRNAIAIYNPRKNPSGRLIYNSAIMPEIRGTKATGPYAGQKFYHKFKQPVRVYAMPDGSLRIVGRKKLWATQKEVDTKGLT